MFDQLPDSTDTMMDWDWAQFQPYYDDLAGRELDAASVSPWLLDWTTITERVVEIGTRLRVATTQDTTDEAARASFQRYLADIQPQAQQADQTLKQKLLDSGLEPDGMAVPLRRMRGEAEIFREANLPLIVEENQLGLEYNRIAGAQTVEWDGEERTLTQMRAVFSEDDRDRREQAWQAIAARQLADRDALNDLWRKYMDLRGQMATNAGFDDYRALRWQQLARYDYTPQDCETFHAAIEEVVVPAATRVYERQRALLGVDTLRPWDLDRDFVYPPARPALKPYDDIEDLERHAETIFQRVDPQLGEYFGIMRREKMLDLGNRKGKGPGGYCTFFATRQRPFIFMNAAGLDSDVRTLLHEAGHAFHGFEAAKLPYAQQRRYTMEFAEVASMAMELLSSPYWTQAEGGYYTEEEVVHARRGHLENILMFWPFMAVVDAFQHWVYTHHNEASDPAACDAQWRELWDRFLPGVDWSGLDDAKATGWQRKLHIFRAPFYYVDYGLAQMGAVQVWRNARQDQAAAVADYKRALAMGGTGTLPELYAAAGAKFAFDSATMREIVDLIESTLAELGVQ